jgi:hypothetical protein
LRIATLDNDLNMLGASSLPPPTGAAAAMGCGLT